jgi:hypothetical protein
MGGGKYGEYSKDYQESSTFESSEEIEGTIASNIVIGERGAQRFFEC